MTMNEERIKIFQHYSRRDGTVWYWVSNTSDHNEIPDHAQEVPYMPPPEPPLWEFEQRIVDDFWNPNPKSSLTKNEKYSPDIALDERDNLIVWKN